MVKNLYKLLFVYKKLTLVINAFLERDIHRVVSTTLSTNLIHIPCRINRKSLNRMGKTYRKI